MCGRLVVLKTINLQPGSRECAALATTRATIAFSCGTIRHSKAIDFDFVFPPRILSCWSCADPVSATIVSRTLPEAIMRRVWFWEHHPGQPLAKRLQTLKEPHPSKAPTRRRREGVSNPRSARSIDDALETALFASAAPPVPPERPTRFRERDRQFESP